MTDEQIIEVLAVKVMEWTNRDFTLRGVPYKTCWVNADATFGAKVEWNPLTNPADSKMVREKLAERFDYIRVEWSKQHGVWNVIAQIPGEFQAEADTEFLAVALCALKTVGVQP